MPYLYRIDVEHKLIILTCEGMITTKNLLDSILAVHTDTNFNPSFDLLIHIKTSKVEEIHPSDILMLAQKRLLDVTTKTALLTNNDLVYGYARMYEAYRDTVTMGEFGTFRNEVEALTWLGRKHLVEKIFPQ